MSTRVWWLVHQWVGLKLTLFMSFILFTGTLAVFSTEIDWLLRPAMRVAPATLTGRIDWARFTANIVREHPDAMIRSISAPPHAWFALTATVEHSMPDGRQRLSFIYGHPATGEIQGTGHWVGAQRILRNLHRHLNMPLVIGVPLVSSLALLLLVTFATSLVIYKKWWRGFFRPVRLQRARVGWGDFHRLAGVWSLWFVLLMTLTGLWYLVESTGGQAPDLPRAKAPAATIEPQRLADSLRTNLAAAESAYPQLRLERILFPTESLGAFRFEGQHEAVLVRERANAVMTAASSGAVLLVADGRELGVHQRISEMADPLHFGYFGGMITKSLWFAFGLLLTGLSVSGAAIHTLRLARRESSDPPRYLARIWRAMGLYRWPAAALVMLGFVLMPWLFLEG